MIVKTDEIDKVILKSNSLFAENAADIIKDKLTQISSLKHRISQYHIETMELEKQVQTLEEELRPFRPSMEIVYKTKEVEDKITDACNLVVNNPSDARNLNY